MKRCLSKLIGCAVRATDGDIGKVRDYYFDDHAWTIRYMVVDTGTWLSGRQVLISTAALSKPDWKSGVFPVKLTMAQVQNSPGIETDKPVSRQHEAELHGYYGWPAYWGYAPYGSGGGFGMSQALPPIAFRQTGERNEEPPERPTEDNPNLRSTSEVTGYHIHATDGGIGHVEDFVVDDETWAIGFLAVNTRNWLPAKHVLLSPHWILWVSWADAKVYVDIKREAVKKSPAFDPSKPINIESESKLMEHLRKTEAKAWVKFKFHAPPKENVYLAGTFNNWNRTIIRLDDDHMGTYSTTVRLPMGRHEYKYIVNGEWRTGSDGREQVPNPFGTTNNVVNVSPPTDRKGHMHTFSRLSVNKDHPMWSTPMGG